MKEIQVGILIIIVILILMLLAILGLKRSIDDSAQDDMEMLMNINSNIIDIKNKVKNVNINGHAIDIKNSKSTKNI